MNPPPSETTQPPRPYLISVESRKGGVGKTTVALNIANDLVFERKYEALVIDLDLAGTNIADEVMSSRVWNKKANLVAGPGDVPTELFQIYRQEARPSQKNTVEDQTTRTATEGLTFKKGRINVLGSSLAGTASGEDPFGSDRNPSILFDQVHALYMLDVVKDIVKRFSAWVQTHPGGKGAVIFDNAPGYAGLQPWLNDWLTDEGPKVGKTVFVCSVDAQDVIACAYACRDVVELAAAKHKIAGKFAALRRATQTQGEDIEISGPEKRFFCRLVMALGERERKGEQNDNLGAFFDNERKSEIVDPREHVALIINKVPIDALGKGTTVNLKRIFEKKADALAERGAGDAERAVLDGARQLVLEQLLSASGVKGSAIRTDDDIALQFCGEYIERELPTGERDEHDAHLTIEVLIRKTLGLEQVDWAHGWSKWRQVYQDCCTATEKGITAFARVSGQRPDFLEVGGYTPMHLDKLGKNVRAAMILKGGVGGTEGAPADERLADANCAKALRTAVAEIVKAAGTTHSPSVLDELSAVCCTAIRFALGNESRADVKQQHRESVFQMAALCVWRQARLLYPVATKTTEARVWKPSGKVFKSLAVKARKEGRIGSDGEWKRVCQSVLPNVEPVRMNAVYAALCKMETRLVDAQPDTVALLEGLLWACSAVKQREFTPGRVRRILSAACYAVIMAKSEGQARMQDILAENAASDQAMAPFEKAAANILNRWAL